MIYRTRLVYTSNLCRSPMAESVLRTRIEEAGVGDLVKIGNAGTGSRHEGDGTDPRTVAVLEENGYDSDHIAREFRPSSFTRLDPVIALRCGHLRSRRHLAPVPQGVEKVRLLRSCDPSTDGDLDVLDPHYGGMELSEECLEMEETANLGLLVALPEQMERQAA